jgi:hypothetical protein
MAQLRADNRNRRRCPVCKGSGVDPGLHRRYTTGGHDDRRCEYCEGECYVEIKDIDDTDQAPSTD